MAKRNGPSDGTCIVCGIHEDANHVFFLCPLARFAWSAMREAAGVSWDPCSLSELVALLDSVQGQGKRVLWTSIGAMRWSLWLTRNKFTIEHVFPAKPADCLFKTCIFLQQWRLLIKEEDWDAFDMMISKIRASAISLSPVQAGN